MKNLETYCVVAAIILAAIVFSIVAAAAGYLSENFGDRKLICHYHITHNAGTKLLDIVKKNNLSWDWVDIPFHLTTKEAEKYLLSKNKDWLEIETPLPHNIPWESKNIIYTIILREPLSRAIAGDGFMNEYPEIKNGDYTRWIREKPQFVDNYTTRWLTNKWTGFQNNTEPPPLSQKDFEMAKAILDKFHIVMILEDFPESARVLCDKLGWEHCDMGQARKRKSPKEIVNNDQLYKELRERNKWDIMLYDYACERSKNLRI